MPAKAEENYELSRKRNSNAENRERGATAIKTITDPDEILACKVKTIERALGITGKEISRICDVSDTTIYRIEGRTKSKAGITENLVRNIAEKTGVSVEWLLDPEGNPNEVRYAEDIASLRALDVTADERHIIREGVDQTEQTGHEKQAARQGRGNTSVRLNRLVVYHRLQGRDLDYSGCLYQ